MSSEGYSLVVKLFLKHTCNGHTAVEYGSDSRTFLTDDCKVPIHH